MSRAIYSNRRREFHDHRTSWKFFERLLETRTNIKENFMFEAMSVRILLEILKELQFINDKGRVDKRSKKK